MGNAAMSFGRDRGNVRVVLMNGEVVEFKQPVRASTVMKKYPDHVVLHCCTAGSQGNGQGRRVSEVLPDQQLKTKENYLITPAQATAKAKVFLESWAFFALKTCNTKTKEKARQKSPKIRKTWIQTVFERIRNSSRSKRISHSGCTGRVPLLLDPSVEYRRSTDGFSDWRPSLPCIPESPIQSSRFSDSFNHNSSYSQYAGQYAHYLDWS